ncbi:MAG: 1-acyl-sn-glycerol-3-phosphate acyltransferase [Paludibacter sp.]|nr:1-acyl-sn-glycerol-3-phosphate acyltransferase [Bacteroidales bacterium]MCM1068944.1 1-acyl-sn-glycerol-3-phosphate acyltransferase [Prevotella sp.]MCM1353607.1 1-acyl-sn-glycerol-3-phosphate acyltransferase [Bacteroides sp.]MCM1442044.1 1-acyl-sn-glycerol-3-phosphate acyltransferase [Muribaculum sp.]MCM1481500.1 1-acyl-sn-glycerol-3-phosphate acyltransferase [Paludibacter sp.]
MEKEFRKAGIGYRLFKHYVRFWHTKVFYRHIYYINQENVPAAGVPVLFASNHQNCACDPLSLLLGLENETHPYVIARGDVFGKTHLVDSFFYWIGLLPAFRLNFDGAEALAKNAETLRVSGDKLLQGNRLIIFPEGGHQDKRWLGDFSFGYTRLAFEAAEADAFQTDIVIMPCAHHYSDYFAVRADLIWRFGKPIHLQDWYELYKTKPRTAQREVNKLVREQIVSLMLNITDLDNYAAIDFIRQSDYGNRFACEQGFNPNCFPEKQESDQRLFAVLETAKKTDADALQFAYDEAVSLQEDYVSLGVTDTALQRQNGWGVALLKIMAQILLLPLWIVTLWPNIILYTVPFALLRTDKMFTNTLRLILAVVLGIPFFCLLTLLIAGLCFGWWWQAALWVLLYPLTVLFAWYDWQWMKTTIEDFRLLTHKKVADILSAKRAHLFASLDELIKHNIDK